MIYFIQAGEAGPVKIGYSRSREGAKKRLRDMATGHYETLHLRAVIPGEQIDEAELHAFWSHRRLRGEWFAPDVLLDVAVFSGAEEDALEVADIAHAGLRWQRWGLTDRQGGLTAAGYEYFKMIEHCMAETDCGLEALADRARDRYALAADLLREKGVKVSPPVACLRRPAPGEGL